MNIYLQRIYRLITCLFIPADDVLRKRAQAESAHFGVVFLVL